MSRILEASVELVDHGLRQPGRACAGDFVFTCNKVLDVHQSQFFAADQQKQLMPKLKRSWRDLSASTFSVSECKDDFFPDPARSSARSFIRVPLSAIFLVFIGSRVGTGFRIDRPSIQDLITARGANP